MITFVYKSFELKQVSMDLTILLWKCHIYTCFSYTISNVMLFKLHYSLLHAIEDEYSHVNYELLPFWQTKCFNNFKQIYIQVSANNEYMYMWNTLWCHKMKEVVSCCSLLCDPCCIPKTNFNADFTIRDYE